MTQQSTPTPVRVVSPLYFKATRDQEFDCEKLTPGDFLQHEDGTWMLLVERLRGSDKWLCQDLLVKPSHK